MSSDVHASFPDSRHIRVKAVRERLPSASPIDIPFAAKEDSPHLIVDDLLSFFPGPYVMLSVFLDESGTHADSPVMCVAGLLYTRAKVRLLDRAWKRALDGAGADYFHSTESAHLQGAFKGMNRAAEDKLYRRLIKLVSRYACGGAVAFITSERHFNEYRRAQSWKYSQYTTCAYACIAVLRDTAAKLDDGQVDLTIESGHTKMGELDAFLRKLKEAGLPLTHGFRDKKDIRPLQTADLWAYETWKRVSEQYNLSPRKLRASLRSLIEAVPNMRSIPLSLESLPTLFEEVKGFLNRVK